MINIFFEGQNGISNKEETIIPLNSDVNVNYWLLEDKEVRI